MAADQPVVEKRYFTVAEANATLPLVQAIVRDITELAQDLRERQGRLARIQPAKGRAISEASEEELRQAQSIFERDQERLVGFENELRNLGVELKDYFTGLVDFPCWMNRREVYLCWRLGEPKIGFWHELDAGFAGRQKLDSRFGNN